MDILEMMNMALDLLGEANASAEADRPVVAKWTKNQMASILIECRPQFSLSTVYLIEDQVVPFNWLSPIDCRFDGEDIEYQIKDRKALTEGEYTYIIDFPSFPPENFKSLVAMSTASKLSLVLAHDYRMADFFQKEKEVMLADFVASDSRLKRPRRKAIKVKESTWL